MSDHEKIKSWSRENNFCYVWSREKIKSWSRENNSLCLITRKLSRDNEKTTFVMSDHEKIKSW